jgi:two-component system phosphate regulon sensor histidine kinase PhoR
VKKKILYVLIGLICIALTGIIAVQILWIRNAIEVRKAQFDRSVNDAMGIAVNKIETKDNLCFIGKSCIRDSVCDVFQHISEDTIVNLEPKLDAMLARESEQRKEKVHHYSRSFNNPIIINPDPNGFARYYDSVVTKYNQEFFIMVETDPTAFFTWNSEELARMDSLFGAQERVLHQTNIKYEFESDEQMGESMVINYSFGSSQGAVVTASLPQQHNIKEKVKKFNKKAVQVQDVMKRMTMEMESRPRPLEERINKKEVQHILQKAFQDKDITLPFEFAVISPGEKQMVTPVKSAGFKPDFISSKYKVSLFPNDIFQKQNLLLVHFSENSSNALLSLSWLMIASILFSFIIVFTSGLSIVVMIRQKKTSDIKTDFINNMTHEFKTPIATISIAVDSINNQKVISQPDVIRNYTRVIKEENNRMNTRVEQVLQMALLDSREFKLDEKVVDIHELIKKVTDNFRLQAENRNGLLNVEYGATLTKVMADESHLTNVVMSLLDNAIKYTPENPVINVKTGNTANGIIISVEDNGIGMNSETQRKIFEKFFRVTSGNIHNIKGFGLGLSYAKAIVLALKGEIKVTSEQGKGSRFEVVLPYKRG